MSEQKIQKEILDFLKDKAYTVKVVSANKNGVPDIICCYQGRFVALEVKAEGGKLTKLQDYNLNKIRSNQGLAYQVGNVEEVKEVLSLVDDEIEIIELHRDKFWERVD